MFLPSQLVEISKRFQRDVDDVQVLLQADGLSFGSAEGVEELSDRLRSDARFRRDIGFLVRSMLGRQGEEAGATELGSMEVLGVLLVAAGGARQNFETSSRQQVIRELLRFVGQQRNSSGFSGETPSVARVERTAPARNPVSPPSMHEELRSLAPRTAAPVEPQAAPVNPVPAPSLVSDELESSSRRLRLGWVVAVVAVVAVLMGLGTWWAMERSDSNAATRQVASVKAPAATSPVSPRVLRPERRVIVPRPEQIRHAGRRPARRVSPATRRREEPAYAAVPTIEAANVPARVERPAPIQSAPRVNQPTNGSTAPVNQPANASVPVVNQSLSPSSSGSNKSVSPSIPAPSAIGPGSTRAAAVSLPKLPQRNAPVPADVSSVFAHPDAANVEVAANVPQPTFRPKEPVLLRRDAPAPAASQADPGAVVHGGSAGAMAGNLMYSPDPEYPADAIAAGVAGEVTVRAVVGPHGNVIDASVVSGPPLLREAALDAIGRWRFRPYEQDGKPVTIATTAIFDFEIPKR